MFSNCDVCACVRMMCAIVMCADDGRVCAGGMGDERGGWMIHCERFPRIVLQNRLDMNKYERYGITTKCGHCGSLNS